MECRIRGFILNKRSVSFFQWCRKAFGCVQLAYTWYKIMWNIRLRANKIKQNKQTKQTNKQKNNWAEGFKELLLLMTVLDRLPKTSPKIQCTFLEVQCQLMYCLLTVSRLQREILPHCAIKVIACDKRTSFLEIIHTCRVEWVRVITKTP